MTRGARCWRCVALGLLSSGLLHATAAGWWLNHRARSGLESKDHLETHPLVLDLAAFSQAPGPPATELTKAPSPPPESATLDSTPAERPEVLTIPGLPSPPEDWPETPAGPITNDALVTSEGPSPAPEPQDAHRPEPAPRPVPQGSVAQRSQSAPRPADEPPIQPSSRSERSPQRPQPRIEGPKGAKKTSPTSPRSTQTQGVKRSDASPQVTGAGQTDPRTSQALGAVGAPAATAKAEASYLAELQRAIARHQRFPDDARKRNKTGTTTLSFVVQGDGGIRQVRVVKSSGDASLDTAAVQAMQRLERFKPIPAVIGRQSWALRVPIRFDLR